jgi:UDP-N-acetylglucosamine 2-epimerase (non-hydrolysing)
MKVLIVCGTRPEVIKLAPVVEALRGRASVRVCATGQHREMLQLALRDFAIEPDIRLDVMSAGQSLNVLASRLLAALDTVIVDEQPDWVVVQGDTTTAFCAGLAAFQRGIQVAHVEAGLRTGDLDSPFPEEANRQLLARIAGFHFAPTMRARDALLAEGIPLADIRVTGNTVVDAVAMIASGWGRGAPKSAAALAEVLGNAPSVLVTCHRRENFGGVLAGICDMLARLGERYPEHCWVFPVHLNPAVRGPVHERLSGLANLHLLDPVDYPTTLWLQQRSRLVVTDSGGIQEEAPSFGVPVVVMRRHTERAEGVEQGFATLAGQDPRQIETAVAAWLKDAGRREALRRRPNPYGDGQAGRRIAAALLGELAEEWHG